MRPAYAAIHSHVLHDALARLDKTYQAFFRRVQRGEEGKQAGFPRYQGRTRWHSFTYKEFGNGATLDNGFLVLSKIGRIRVPVHWSRPLEGRPKTVMISREADGWYVAFSSCADVPVQPLSPPGRETAIDLGLESFATRSDGTRILTPRCYRKAEAHLGHCQRRVSRRKQGSHRRRKAFVLLAKAPQTVRRHRQDFHHKVALQLVRAHDVIVHEELQTANLVRHHHLAKSLQDAGWAAFLSILSFQAACARRSGNRRGQSCVHQSALFWLWRGGPERFCLSVPWHDCPEGGASLHRDHTAAKNIEWRGQRLRGGVALAASANREPAAL
jgi:putative transposase